VLVHCPNCNVDFCPSFRICTTCGKYKPSLDEIRDYLLREASELLSEGKSPEQVRGMFVDFSGSNGGFFHGLLLGPVRMWFGVVDGWDYSGRERPTRGVTRHSHIAGCDVVST